MGENKKRSLRYKRWVFNGAAWEPEIKTQRQQIRSPEDLDVFNSAYTLAMEVFTLTLQFPKDERYSLTDQIRRSSRAVCANLVEGFAKSRHEAVFKNSLNDSLGEAEETKLWLNFALDCKYLSEEDYRRLIGGYDQVSAMLWTLMTHWQTFA